jgi:uncharacterized protein (DUF885 family)
MPTDIAPLSAARTDLAELATAYYDFRQRVGPTGAHLEGDYRFADQFDDASRAGEDREIAEGLDFVRRAEAIPEETLSAQERITRSMLAWDAGIRAERAASRLAEFAVNPIFGVQSMLPVWIPKLSLPTADVAEAMLGKYHGVATLFRDMNDRLREGVANRRTPAAFAVRMSIEQLDTWLARPLDDDPMLTVAPTPGLADPGREGWLARLRDVIAADVRPAMAEHRDLLHDEVLPVARSDEQVGLTWLADGDAAYDTAIRFFTTLPLSAQEIHEIGLRQVASLAEEYRALGPQVLGTSDLPRILEGLRSDPALHHTRAEDIVTAAQTAMAKAKAAMGDWFGVLPRADCTVEETKRGAIAFYFPPVRDGSRGGVFFMNVSEPSEWSRYSIEATAYHEGIPGHHLQVAISLELEGVPDFRKRAWIAAYGEGWGLYAERLADEMGLYTGPLERMGMLSADSMRACRLVVDTGMHAFGWSRRKAIDYMLENSPMGEGHVTSEIDRYAVLPGQALAYMVGRLEIQRIRRAAEASLGARFDIRAFHDTVLGSGLLPLPMLDQLVRAWAAAG